MLRSFIISAIRNMLRNKLQSIIQIFSLAVGLTVFLLVALYLYDEMTVDSTIKDHKEVYRVEFTDAINDYRVPFALGTLLPEHIPEIESLTRYRGGFGNISRKKLSSLNLNRLIHFNDTNPSLKTEISLWNSATVDSSFFSVFAIDFIRGDPASALQDPSSIVLTERISEELFGQQNPMGEILYNENGDHFTVTGLIPDPVNTHLQYEVLRPFFNSYYETRYFFNGQQFSLLTYVRLNKFANKNEVERKMTDIWGPIVEEYNKEIELGWKYLGGRKIFLRPLKDVYLLRIKGLLWASPELEPAAYGNKDFLKGFFLLGLIILILGVVNYVNLSTARASARAREIAMKKIVGSTRSQLVLFFLIESVITAMFSFLVALSCLQILFPNFNHLLLAEIDLFFLADPLPWIICLVFIIIVGVLAGLYPSLNLSTGPAILTPYKKTRYSGKGLNTRRILMVMQFTITVILIIGILVTQNQIRYMKHLDPGFETDRVLFCNLGWIITHEPEYTDLIKSRLQKYPGVEAVSFSQQIPGFYILEEWKTPYYPLFGSTFCIIRSDEDYLDLMGLNIVEGTGFNKPSITSLPPDSVMYRFFILNETMVNALGLTDPAGKHLRTILRNKGRGPFITGVVEDFHFHSFRADVQPLMINYTKNQFRFINLKVKPGFMDHNWKEIEMEIETVVKLIFQKRDKHYIPRRYEFTPIDEFMDSFYNKEQRLADSFIYISGLALLIACLGLFGLSTFMAQRRTKEIGIRKAMGSTERQIFMLLAKDFTKWVGLSILIGCPIGWFAMNKWLQQFAYRINIGLWVFGLTAAVSFAVAFLTIFRQSRKTARANPLDALKYE